MAQVLNPERDFQKYLEKYPEEKRYLEDIQNIASSIVNALNIKPGEADLIRSDPHAEPLSYNLFNELTKRGARAVFYRTNPQYDVDEAMRMSTIPQIFTRQKDLAQRADRIFFIRASDPKLLDQLPPANKIAYHAAFRNAFKRIESGEARWMRIDWPTEEEAKIEGLDYRNYFEQFLKACNQDWSKIHNAQSRLIRMLNAGSDLRFIVDNTDPAKRTDVGMSIKGFTFANSTIVQNYPGSEVFSAPELTSVNGQVYTPDRFIHLGAVMAGIRLIIKDGQVIDASAEEGMDTLERLLSARGMRYFGEIAFGTNPGIMRQFLNAVLVEKRAGTFHLALGSCEDSKKYPTLKGFQPLWANNGNTRAKTDYHVDLVIPLLENNLTILDGKIIQRNGRFLNPTLKALNPAV